VPEGKQLMPKVNPYKIKDQTTKALPLKAKAPTDTLLKKVKAE